MASMKGKVVVLVGCASGMGAATLKMLLAAGATVIGFDNNRENMADTLDERGLRPSAIIIDDKWQKEYGTALPKPEKWPDS